MDALWNQYMLSIGDAGDMPNAFDENPLKHGLYFLFFMTTFMTQIVFLNMIIAVMGDTFDRMMEIKPVLSVRQ